MSLPGLHARGKAIGELPALGLLTLAGLLPPDWTCSYLPASHVDEALVENIAAERPTLVAISALTPSAPEAYRLCESLRARGIRSVLGGLHATVCPEEAAQFADAVTVGAGEGVWLQLLADAAAGSLQKIYRHAGREQTWPTPRFELLGQSPLRYTLQTARGCPLACDFCGASRLLGPFRQKPIERIRDELAAIRTRDAEPRIELADDNTFAGDRPPDELFAALEAANARYFTEADWRIGERPDVLAGLARSGCVQVLMGIESLVFRYPAMGDKQAELERMVAAAEAVQSAGVAVNACFILGADGETNASIDRLTEFLLASPFAEIQLTLQTPFPGTGLYRRLARERRLLADRDWSYYTLFDVTYEPDAMSVAELEAGFRHAVSAIFADGPTARRTEIRKAIARTARSLRR